MLFFCFFFPANLRTCYVNFRDEINEKTQLDNLRCAMFDMAQRLFGLEFKRVDQQQQLPLMFAEQQVRRGLPDVFIFI